MCLEYITIIEEVKSTGSKLKDKTFCITGTLSKPRSYFEDLIKENGGLIKSVSSKLDFLLIGEDCGSKLSKAEKLGVKIITENEFLKMV